LRTILSFIILNQTNVMFKKLSLAICLLTLTQALLVAQKVDSTATNNKLLANIKFKELLSAKSVRVKDSLMYKKADVLLKDTLLSKNSKDSFSVKETTALIPQQLDSIWLKTGDTLVGFIKLDKDKNVFLFSKDTLENIEVKSDEVIRLIAFPKNSDEDRLDVFSMFNDFYYLENPPDAIIRIFASRKFKAVLNDGPKHFIVENKYCLFKNDTPYFLNSGRTKDILTLLMNDCKVVMDGFKKGKYSKNNFIEAIAQYNRCNK
jgi:hypothetical protein